MGHQTVYDHMFLDGLEDAYDKGRLMGTFAEDCASTFAFTREAQDAFALASLSRALAANNDGTFAWETAPVTVAGKKGDVVVDTDEYPKHGTTMDSIARGAVAALERDIRDAVTGALLARAKRIEVLRGPRDYTAVRQALVRAGYNGEQIVVVGPTDVQHQLLR